MTASTSLSLVNILGDHFKSRYHFRDPFRSVYRSLLEQDVRSSNFDANVPESQGLKFAKLLNSLKDKIVKFDCG